jgi:hypothetical protein
VHEKSNSTAWQYDKSSDSADIPIGGKQTFPTGEEITVLGEITTGTDGTLTGNAVYSISKGEKSASPSS